jgi:hypothetical protein
LAPIERFLKEISGKVESASMPLCSGRLPTVEGCRVGGGDTAAAMGCVKQAICLEEFFFFVVLCLD